eukprot:GFUD01007349.1.p1 GENE.GFUD01007349.1~~GFUD01007349.1.p1  ORF type:complete len:681 (+),score=167.52 GFUD01007349.1:40-2082(+)
MAERNQPTRTTKLVVPEDDFKNSIDDIDESCEVDDIQQRLKELLGSDDDDDMDYTPHLVECELSDDDDKDDKKSTKRAHSEPHNDLLNYTPTSADEDEVSTRGDDDTKPMDDTNLDEGADLADYSDIVFNTNERVKVQLPMKKKFTPRNPLGRISSEVYIRDLKCHPTELKKNLDRLHPVHFTYSKKNVTEAHKDQVLQELVRMVPEGDPEAACSLVVEIMKRPKSFWSVHFIDWNYEVEEIGLICVQILERLISNRELFMEMVLKLGKISSKWRFKNCLNSKKFKFIPKTMTRCAQILLAEGDVKGLEELFEDFRTNLRNVSGEKTLVLYRCVSAMVEKKRFDESSDAISLGGTSFGTSFTNKAAGPQPGTIISELKTAIKDKRDVDWLMPLFAWYVMDEKCADDVKDLLTEYRDENIDHLPAHQHLLEFLFQEYEDETDILIEELNIFCKEFPWDGNVLRYCKLLVKKGEDDDLEESFDSSEDKDSSEKLENYREVFGIAVKFLDYEINKDVKQCWELLAESLKFFHSSHKETSFLHSSSKEISFLNTSFEDRGGWWVDQNFKNLESCDTDLLVKKGLVAVFLYGQSYEKYLEVLNILEQRNRSFPSPSFSNLLKEMKSSAQMVSTPCLDLFQPDFSSVDRRWNLREWNKIKHIKHFVSSKNNKTFHEKRNREQINAK